MEFVFKIIQIWLTIDAWRSEESIEISNFPTDEATFKFSSLVGLVQNL